MGAAPFRSFGDLSLDRGDLYAVHHATEGQLFAIAVLIGVWCLAIVGIVLKIARPGRYDRLATGLYLAMGWSGMMLYDAVVRSCRR